jgi:hypothetical protein
MAWTIPDKGEQASNLMSILFQEYLDVLVAGLNGIDCVLSGCAVTAQGSPDMTCAVAKGAVLSNGTLFPVTAGNVTIGTADATNPRLDLVVVNSSGTKAVRAGTAAATPQPPARSANDVVIAVVYVPANDTTISTNQINDLRVIRTQGPIVLKKTTTAVSFNTTNAIQTYFTITLPSGLFLTGRQLRVTCGGNFLLNSGTPIITLTIAYGGTTMFADAAIIGAADADRGAWFLDVVLTAVSGSSQKLDGQLSLDPTIAQRVAPTSGVAGNISLSGTAANQALIAPFDGSASVDSDAADRTLTVQWTMDTSNSADEILMAFGVAELL